MRHAARRALGGAVLALSCLPLYRLIDIPGEAPVREATVATAEATLSYAAWGSLIVVLGAVVLSRVAPGVPARLGRSARRLLSAPEPVTFAALAGGLAFALALAVSKFLYLDLFTNVDEMASFIQARHLARGLVAGPVPVLPEGWLIPNMLVTDAGWVSQYPPTHLAALAAFVRLGAPALAGPALFASSAALTALVLPRLVPSRPVVMRGAALLTATSPMLLFLAGGALSHLSAGAALLLTIWAALRARDGHAGWSVLAGVGIGTAVSARPWVGVLLGTLIPLCLWGDGFRRHGAGWALRRLGGMVAGGLPFAAALGAYHAHVFGDPTRWGYLAAFGESHALGFHTDPWGYHYGIDDALGFTSADLIAAGVQLLETPPPLTWVVAIFLLVAPAGLPRGAAFLVGWALVPVLGNAFYWFHAPRMLYEAAPAWVALAALAVSVGFRPDPGGREQVSGGGVARPARSVIGWSVVLAFAAPLATGIPDRWRNFAWDAETLERVTVPRLPGPDPALVFVHTSWNERLSATLQGAGGMRQDSVTTALRLNTGCELQRYADAREASVRSPSAGSPLPELTFSEEAGSGTDARGRLVLRRLGAGFPIRAREGEVLAPQCVRQARADRFGTVALAPLLWQGDLPGDERGRPMFVRDLGPVKNARIRAAYPGRTAWALTPTVEGGRPELLPFEEAMRLLWGGG